MFARWFDSKLCRRPLSSSAVNLRKFKAGWRINKRAKRETIAHRAFVCARMGTFSPKNLVEQSDVFALSRRSRVGCSSFELVHTLASVTGGPSSLPLLPEDRTPVRCRESKQLIFPFWQSTNSCWESRKPIRIPFSFSLFLSS